MGLVGLACKEPPLCVPCPGLGVGLCSVVCPAAPVLRLSARRRSLCNPRFRSVPVTAPWLHRRHRRVDACLRKHTVAQARATPPHTVATVPRTPSRRARNHIRHQATLPPSLTHTRHQATLPPSPTHTRPRPRHHPRPLRPNPLNPNPSLSTLTPREPLALAPPPTPALSPTPPES